MSSAPIRGVLFDAGGVLVVPDPVSISMVLEPFGADVGLAHLVRCHYAGMRAQDVTAATGGGESWHDYRLGLCRAAGVGPERLDAAAHALSEIWSPYLWRFPLAGAVRVLQQLHLAGVPIGVVSNASGQIEAVLSQAVCQVGQGAGVPVRCVVDSEVVGVAKPDPAIFTSAIAALGLDAGEIAYVGDSVRNDVAGAKAAGLVGLHLDPFDDHADAEHRRIRSLAEVPALVAR